MLASDKRTGSSPEFHSQRDLLRSAQTSLKPSGANRTTPYQALEAMDVLYGKMSFGQ